MNTEDSSWIFDSLICFLNGPVWNAPLQSFIEEKSLIFEPTNREDAEYRKIYEEFKNLVDLMLGSYMEDMGITPEQFEEACGKQYTSGLPMQFHQNLFEQIWAANDYEIFKRLMTQRNIELQFQALKLIEQRYGATPQSYLPFDESSNAAEDNKTNDMRPTEFQRDVVLNPHNDPVLDQVIKECTFGDKTDETFVEIERLPKDYQHLEYELKNEKQLLKNALQTVVTRKEPFEEYLETEKKTDDSIEKVTSKTDNEDVKKRQQYLKAQRDRLVALKKQVREKQLKVDMESQNYERPKSAKAAEAVLAGNAEPDSHSLHVRRVLAERLRSEVVTQQEPLF